ncbi:MAG TPA: polysaccharide deacetylase family protein [Fimbriimonadaceae bacterium]|jgi:peptidoglycan/xylan/chitin deacetylase (PgdA/CDA1 family)
MKHLFLLLGFIATIGTSFAQKQPAFLLHAGTSYQTFQDPANWTSYDASVSADSAHEQNGVPSLMLTAVPGSNAHMHKAISTNFNSMTTITMWVYAQYPVNSDGWHAASIYLTNDNYQDYFLATTQQLHPGWSKLTFSKSDFVPSGNPSWSNTMTTMQLALFGDTTAGMSVSFADMEMNSFTRPKVIIAFDDNYSSSYTYGYQYLQKYGFSGTEFVISSYVDQAGRATTAQLQQMYNSGWDMCNHTTTHPDLRTLTEAQVFNEYETCANFLVAKGWTRNQGYRHVAYPYGYFNSTVLAADSAAGILTARTVMETLPQANQIDSQYLLYSQVPDSTSQTRADIIASVNQVVADGGALEITFHNITPTPQVAIDWNDQDFEAIIDYIASLQQAGSLDVMTFTQWYAGVTATQSTQTVPLNYVQTNAPTSAVGIPNSLKLYLASAAPASEPITISANSTAVQIPGSASFAAGSTSLTVPFNTTAVAKNTVVTITSTAGGKTLTCQFTLMAEAPNYILLDASSVVGGTSTTGHVWMLGPAPAAGCIVAVTSSLAGVKLTPSNVNVPASWFHGDFTVQTPKVTKTTTVTIKATFNGISCTIPLTITP